MKLVVTIEGTETILNVDISDDISLADFKAYLEAETDIKPQEQKLLFNSKELSGESSSLVELGLADEDLLVLKGPTASHQQTQAPQGQQSDEAIEAERQTLLNDPMVRGSLGNPQLSSILNNSQAFRDFVRGAQAARGPNNGFQSALGTEPLYDQEIARLRSLPDNAENRRKIQELEDLQAIEENRMLAYEMAPESLFQVPMLYIRMEVNNVPVKAFVDTGAQMTIMSPRLADQCGLKRLIDKRFRGEARGVGSGQILGRIHSAPVKIEDAYIPCSFVILESGVDLILGLDMLRRHQANVNLKEMKLYISDVQTAFLSESESQDTMFGSFGSPGNQLGGSDPKKQKLGNASSAATAASAAASAAAARASSTTQTQTQAETAADPAKVEQLVGLGFTRDQAKVALQQCNGNVDLAASLLFQ